MEKIPFEIQSNSPVQLSSPIVQSNCPVQLSSPTVQSSPVHVLYYAGIKWYVDEIEYLWNLTVIKNFSNPDCYLFVY